MRVSTIASTVVLCLSLSAHAAELELGREQGVRSVFCTTAMDAIRIATAHSEQGIGAARVLYDSIDECDRVEAIVTPRRVVFSAPTEDGMVRVVEVSVLLIDGGRQTYYMLTDARVFDRVGT